MIDFRLDDIENLTASGPIIAFLGQKEPYSWAHIAVWSEESVERTKVELGTWAKGREVREVEGQFELREPGASYQGHFGPEKSDIGAENTYSWNDY